MGEEEEDRFPGISHITSVAMAIALSVCTCSEQQLHPEPQSQAVLVGPFWSVGNKQWGYLLQKQVMGREGGVIEREEEFANMH